MIYTAEEYFEQGQGIVTICGSTKFFTECMEVNKQLTFKGWIVLACGSWGHSFHKFSLSENTDYSRVKTLHYHKILMSNAIVVVSDSSCYIGQSTKAEIAFAQHRNIPVFYSQGFGFIGETNHKPPQEFLDTSLIDEFAKEYGGLGF